jgi:hypothetical protein
MQQCALQQFLLRIVELGPTESDVEDIDGFLAAGGDHSHLDIAAAVRQLGADYIQQSGTIFRFHFENCVMAVRGVVEANERFEVHGCFSFRAEIIKQLFFQAASHLANSEFRFA